MYFCKSKIIVYLVLFLFIINLIEDVFALKNKNKTKILSSSQFDSPWLSQQHLFAFPQYGTKRPIKDAAFGGLLNNKCYPTARMEKSATYNECMKYFLAYTPDDGYDGNDNNVNIFGRSYGIGSTFANWYNNTCEILTKAPNCLYYSKDNIAFTSTDVIDGLQYDLAPCINTSEGWKGEIPCGNSDTEIFICQKGKWTNQNNKTIQECQNNVEKPILDKHKQMPSEGDEEEFNVLPEEKNVPQEIKIDTSTKRPIKDAAFGILLDNTCHPSAVTQKTMTLNECIELLLAYTPDDGYDINDNNVNKIFGRSYGIGSKFANWYKNTCEILLEAPNCLYYSKDNIAFSDFIDGLQYDLAPCINTSEGWKGEIPCGNSNTEIFICQKGKWTNQNNKTIQECQNNVEKPILDKHTQIPSKGDEGKFDVPEEKNVPHERKIVQEENIDTSNKHTPMPSKDDEEKFNFLPQKKNVSQEMRILQEENINTSSKRPMKDAAFGGLLNNVCYPIARRTRTAAFNKCVELLLEYKLPDGYNSSVNNFNKIFTHSYGIGSKFANWYNNTCEILLEAPDCLYYSKDNIAFTSTDVIDGLQYDLAPCISTSEGWKGEIPCGNSDTEIFICKKGKWTNQNNKTIQECQNNVKKHKQQNNDTSRGMKSWKNSEIIAIIFLFIICLN